MPRNPKAMGDIGAMSSGALAEDLNFEDIATSSPTTPVVSPEVENGTVFVPSQDDTTQAQQGDQPHVHGGDSGGFFNEVNDDMDDAPLRELMKMWDAGTREEARDADGETSQPHTSTWWQHCEVQGNVSEP